MRKSFLLFCLACAMAAPAQTSQNPATSAAKPATAHPATAVARLPPGVPPVPGPVDTAFSLKYQEIKIGTGAEAVPFKVYKVFYTGYRAADGVKFDSPDDHRSPITGPDGKPELGPDGNPKLGDPEPLAFAQGTGRLPPGFELGFLGMRVGGKRRLYVPWQLAYGTRDMPAQPARNGRPAHPGIPARSDLIFDVELVDVSQVPPQHPPMGATPPPAGAPSGSAAPTTPPPPSQPAQPQSPPPQSRQ